MIKLSVLLVFASATQVICYPDNYYRGQSEQHQYDSQTDFADDLEEHGINTQPQYDQQSPLIDSTYHVPQYDQQTRESAVVRFGRSLASPHDTYRQSNGWKHYQQTQQSQEHDGQGTNFNFPQQTTGTGPQEQPSDVGYEQPENPDNKHPNTQYTKTTSRRRGPKNTNVQFTSEDCILPVENKQNNLCTGRIPVFFWNIYLNQCDQAYYGGCHATKNNFQTLEQCNRAASSVCKK